MEIRSTVEALLQQRFNALKNQAFVDAYASYHPHAPFIEQFPTTQSYVAFAEQALAGMKILHTHVGAIRETDDGVEIICGMCFELNGETQTLYELALFLPVADTWKYHSAQKLTPEDFSGEFTQLDFEFFDQQLTKIRF